MKIVAYIWIQYKECKKVDNDIEKSHAKFMSQQKKLKQLFLLPEGQRKLHKKNLYI